MRNKTKGLVEGAAAAGAIGYALSSPEHREQAKRAGKAGLKVIGIVVLAVAILGIILLVSLAHAGQG